MLLEVTSNQNQEKPEMKQFKSVAAEKFLKSLIAIYSEAYAIQLKHLPNFNCKSGCRGMFLL